MKTIFKNTRLVIFALMATFFISVPVAQAGVLSFLTHSVIHHEEYKAVDSALYKRNHQQNTAYQSPQYNASYVSDGNTANVHGSANYCVSNLPNGQTPTYTNTMYLQKTKLLCSEAMTTLASGVTRTGLWSAELLTPQRIAMTKQISRKNTFHPELQLPSDWQAQLSDYVHSGYDRGHIAPSGDMPTAETQNDSFSLANMAPQAPRFNRGVWAHLEESVRTLAERENLYVVTGVLFNGNQIGFLKNRVAIPTQYFKMVYSPSTQSASVFWGYNKDDTQIIQSTVSDFYRQFGIDFHVGQVNTLNLPTSGSHSRYTD